jgi:uncharacterized protein with HEPN domain
MPETPVSLLLQQCLQSLSANESYFESIEKEEDFLTTLQGQMAFDAICMRLQVFGENLKKIT